MTQKISHILHNMRQLVNIYHHLILLQQNIIDV